MNPTRLFRAQPVAAPGTWVYGYYVVIDDVPYIVPVDAPNESELMDDWFRVIPETVGQYIGKMDDGTDLYQHDIVYDNDSPGAHYIIEWSDNDKRWIDTRMEDGNSITLDEGFCTIFSLKIVGNKFDTPAPTT